MAQEEKTPEELEAEAAELRASEKAKAIAAEAALVLAQAQAAGFIESTYGKIYLPGHPYHWRSLPREKGDEEPEPETQIKIGEAPRARVKRPALMSWQVLGLAFMLSPPIVLARDRLRRAGLPVPPESELETTWKRESAEREAYEGQAHECHAEGCTHKVAPRFLMCRGHWKRVTPELQAAVWATYRDGQEKFKDPTAEYLRAARAAIDHVKKLEDEQRAWEASAKTRTVPTVDAGAPAPSPSPAPQGAALGPGAPPPPRKTRAKAAKPTQPESPQTALFAPQKQA